MESVAIFSCPPGGDGGIATAGLFEAFDFLTYPLCDFYCPTATLNMQARSSSMKRSNFIASLLTVGFAAVAFAQGGTTSATTGNPHYGGAELRELVREAHTASQYRALAGVYTQQEASYQRQAAEEKQEWERRSVNVSGPAAKFPRPVDSAKNLYEYYSYEADRAGSLASHYRQLELSSEAAHAQ
jgi:hypothetical protein